jgi:hypothetical protein
MKKALLTIALISMVILCITSCAVTASDITAAKLILVCKDGRQSTIGMDELKDMAITDFKTEQEGCTHTIEKNTHRGILLRDILKQAGVDMDKLTELDVTAADDFKKIYTKAQIDAPEKMYLVFEIDGKPPADPSGNNCFYIVVRDDPGKSNWTKYPVKIEVR